VSDGRAFILRQRRYQLRKLSTDDDNDCRWVNYRSETITIERNGRTTQIHHHDSGPSEVEQDAFTAPWSLGKMEQYPVRLSAGNLRLRCAARDALAGTDVLRPMAPK